jgi:hypothetical protein
MDSRQKHAGMTMTIYPVNVYTNITITIIKSITKGRFLKNNRLIQVIIKGRSFFIENCNVHSDY